MMLKSFLKFIGESQESKLEFNKDLALKLLNKIKLFKSPQPQEYQIFGGMEFREPFTFDLILEIRKDRNFFAEKDSHFKGLPWEQLNFREDGYSIDANTRINHKGLTIPEIKITLVVDPSKEPHLYKSLHARILDILVHETNHLDQTSLTGDPFTLNPTIGKKREAAKKNYKYFLLQDEIESMVEGMYARSEQLKVPLDEIFTDYLKPFIISKYISPKEYRIVMESWVKHAIERYPEANFSKKVEKIVNSI